MLALYGAWCLQICWKVPFTMKTMRTFDASTISKPSFTKKKMLKFLTMKMIDPLPMTANNENFNCAMTNRYSNLTSAIATKKTKMGEVAPVFVEDRGVQYDISDCFSMGSDPQFFEKFCNAIYVTMGIRLMMKTVYRRYTSWQTSRFDKTNASQYYF